MREVLARIHQLGSPGPSFSQLDVLGKNAVLEAMRQSIWTRHFELLPAPNRHRLNDIVRQWAVMVERGIAQRRNEPKEETDNANAA
jgi:hypothetical protein